MALSLVMKFVCCLFPWREAERYVVDSGGRVFHKSRSSFRYFLDFADYIFIYA